MNSRASLLFRGLLLAGCSATWGQTWPYLDAPVADSYIRVRQGDDPKKLVWDIPENKREVFRPLPDGKLFLTHGSIYVTYPLLNPLKVRATASATGADDPSHATIGSLIAQILSVLVTVAPSSASLADVAKNLGIKPLTKAGTESGKKVVPETCDATDSASKNITWVVTYLYGSETSPAGLSETVKSWSDAIDNAFAAGESGPAAVRKGIEQINVDTRLLDEAIKSAAPFLARIRECTPDNSPARPAEVERVGEPKLPEKPKTTDSAALDKYKNDLLEYAEKLPKWKTYQDYLRELNLYENYIPYQLTLLADPERRIREIQSAAAAMRKLAQQLESDYANPRKWVSARRSRSQTDYIIGAVIEPTFEKLQNATIKVVREELTVNIVTGTISTANPEEGAGTLTVRKFSRFAVEPGIGAVFGTVKRPTYSTKQNDEGKTEVVRIPEGTVSVNPSLMVNFVCRCGLGALTPMLQIGAATSKTLPALLLGGGLRLFGVGKGDIAIGGGAMFAWPKDLQKLKEGSIVKDQAEIDADLGYASQPKIGGYFTIQYKF